MNWIIRIVAAEIVWVFVGLILVFIGGLLVTVNSTQIVSVGNFLKDNAYLLGFLAGAAWFIWGHLPTRLTP